MSDVCEPVDNENDMTELTIGPDGRVFVFGTSRQVLEVLEVLQPNDRKLRQLLDHVRRIETESLRREIPARAVS